MQWQWNYLLGQQILATVWLIITWLAEGGGLGRGLAGHEVARYNLGCMEDHSGNMERALKHWTIAASAGCYTAMYHLMTLVKKGYVSKESSTQLWQLTIIPALR
jgi:hypothetical protein